MRKILVIHPDLVLGDDLTFILQHSGFQVAHAMEGQQALAEISRSCPDLIVMAESSPKLNGDELCIRIREFARLPSSSWGRTTRKRLELTCWKWGLILI